MLISSVESIIVFLLECFWYYVISKKSSAVQDSSNEISLKNDVTEFIKCNSQNEYIKSQETVRKKNHKIHVKPSSKQILNV